MMVYYHFTMRGGERTMKDAWPKRSSLHPCRRSFALFAVRLEVRSCTDIGEGVKLVTKR